MPCQCWQLNIFQFFNEAPESSARCSTFTKHVETLTPPMSADSLLPGRRTVKDLSSNNRKLTRNGSLYFMFARSVAHPPIVYQFHSHG